MGAFLFILLMTAGILHKSLQTEYIPSDKDICRLFKDGTKLREPGYCDRWITCENFVSVPGDVCPDGKTYTKTACGTAKDSYCTATPCSGSTSGYVADNRHCSGWYYCDGKSALANGFCDPDGTMHYDSATGVCVYPSQTSCQKKFEVCDVTPQGVKFLDENRCESYFTCSSSGSLQSELCDKDKYFDVYTGECIAKSKVVCKAHPLPENVCGTTKLAFRNRFVPDGATCRGYFYCRDLGSGRPDPNPVWAQCPLWAFFNAEKEACTERESVKCLEDRCDGRTDGELEISETPGCQNYLVCQNNSLVEELTCDNGLYFNVEKQECTSTKKSYNACLSN